MAAECTCRTSKTLAWEDLRAADVAPACAELRRFACRLGMRGTPFAVNGVLKRRWWVRRAKMWEYARGLACVLGAAQPTDEAQTQRAQSSAAKTRVIDFGGGATLPVFWLAERGAEVLCLDVDAALVAHTNRVAQQRGWKLQASTHDLTQAAAPAEWGAFDAVISFSVLEHMAFAQQELALARLAGLLRPGGVMAITFDFGAQAAQPFAIRDAQDVARLARATGLAFLDQRGFVDSGERFVLDKRHRTKRFTFASLMMGRSGSFMVDR
jgi:2-polyprenyl-3-methyl-5-hydroxy-6-metoxy-1,4-benzoquinol methylase